MEEDIKKIENMIKNWHKPTVEIDIKPIENLLKAYKKLKEENRLYLLSNSPALAIWIKDSYIPKSAIKETIEKLNREEQELQNSISDEEREEYSDASISFGLMDINIRREVLEELLEDK